ncbi:hypothetical protein BDW75DRAFT_251623 [Aspergillus navahoensis]
MDGISETASLVTLVHLAATIINYIRSIVDAPVQKKKLLAALIQARGLLSTLVELTDEVKDEDWSYTIQSLSAPNGPLSTFQELLEHIARKIGTSLQETVASLEKLKSHFLLAMAIDHIRLSKGIRNEIHELRRQLAEVAVRTQRQILVSLSKEQELIVNSLASRNLSHEMGADEIMNMRAGAEWFLRHENFKHWHGTNPVPSVLVLTGPPGSGKSTMCQVTRFFLKAWHQCKLDVCVAYFAFHFTQQEKLSSSLVLSNIVQQILLERPHLVEHLAALRITGGPLSLTESIDLINRARHDLNQFYLILDGLDECEKTSQEVIKALLSIEPPISILVGARPTEAFSEIFQECASTITTELGKNARIAEYLDHDPANIAKAAKLIFQQHGWNWICMTASLNVLAQTETRAIFDRLSYNPPSSTVEFYELMLENIMCQPNELAVLAKKTLRIILDTAGSVNICKLVKV